jgi:hypothetical protein
MDQFAVQDDLDLRPDFNALEEAFPHAGGHLILREGLATAMPDVANVPFLVDVNNAMPAIVFALCQPTALLFQPANRRGLHPKTTIRMRWKEELAAHGFPFFNFSTTLSKLSPIILIHLVAPGSILRPILQQL